MRSVELFTGAGGLALGLQTAGFRSEMMVERDADACRSIRANQRPGGPTSQWPLVEADVRTVDFRPFIGKIDLLAGGPPCQPFSIGGKHRGPNDERDMWPQAIRAVKEIQPKAFVFENVRGLTRSVFADYLRYVVARLREPMLVQRSNESWSSHLRRLEAVRPSSGRCGYVVTVNVVNAADYGAAQKRHRVLIVGIRNDLGIDWKFPVRTHSPEILAKEKWITGDYWARHRLTPPEGLRPSKAEIVDLRRAQSLLPFSETFAWRTVRDALSGLPEPEVCEGSIPNHKLQLGARVYVGHTGSVWDEPAKALKAGDHGVPGGENMLVAPGRRPRYFTIRESARLQGFPDDYIFDGSWTECMRQLGNAVPVELGASIARSLGSALRTSNPKIRTTPMRTKAA